MIKKTLNVILIAFFVFILTGCTVGDNFIQPANPQIKKYTAMELPESLSMPDDSTREQVFLIVNSISHEWWKIFESKKLNSLLKEVYEKNPTLKANFARLNASKELLASQKGLIYPQVDITVNAVRQKTSGAGFGMKGGAFDNTFTLYTAGFDISYNIDLFGLVKRSIEVKEAQVNYNESIIRGTYLTLTGNIVNLAISEAFLREQRNIIIEILEIQRRILSLTEERERKGVGSNLDILNAKAKITNTESLLPQIEQSISIIRHNLSILCGKPPSLSEEVSEFFISDFKMPMELPVIIPSELVRNRPDIVASEYLLKISNAEVGIATANLYPNINISGLLLSQGMELGDLLEPSKGIWRLGASIVEPIFNSGRLYAEKRAAVFRYQETLANYENTVLNAFSQVADVLIKIVNDSKELSLREKAIKISKESLDLAENLYKIGKSSYLELLTAQETYSNSKLQHIQTLQKRYQDTVALFVVLGGGWDRDKVLFN